eukprot:SAG25_NODE_66_length_17563_cov_34.737918_5_plen_290_part_00
MGTAVPTALGRGRVGKSINLRVEIAVGCMFWAVYFYMHVRSRYIREAEARALEEASDSSELEAELQKLREIFDAVLDMSEVDLRRDLILLTECPDYIEDFMRAAYFRMATPAGWLESWGEALAQIPDSDAKADLFPTGTFMDACTKFDDEEVGENIGIATEKLQELCARHSVRNRPELDENVELRPGVQPMRLWLRIFTEISQQYRGEQAPLDGAVDTYLRRPPVTHKAHMGCFHLVLKNINCGGMTFDKLFLRDFVSVAWNRPTVGMENWVLFPGDPSSWYVLHTIDV